jgi:hypothetical protein
MVTGKPKTVAVTRILNEDDIAEAFVRHHAALVEHHLFLDNGSTDGTLEILKSLQDEGLNITVLQNRTPFFTEVSYNTSLFRQAWKMFSPDWVAFVDTDEFIDPRPISGDLSGWLGGMPEEVDCLSLSSFTYFDLPDDDPEELLVPLRMRNRQRFTKQAIAKVIVRGALAQEGATIEAGQHQVVRSSGPITPFSDHEARLGHFYRRSAYQAVSKAVMCHLKVLAAGQKEREKNRSIHYRELFQTVRDSPKSLSDPSFLRPAYVGEDIVEDPLPYLGGSLRYTRPGDPFYKAVRVLIGYAEQLAENHGQFIDTNLGVRLQAEQLTSVWTVLF